VPETSAHAFVSVSYEITTGEADIAFGSPRRRVITVARRSSAPLRRVL